MSNPINNSEIIKDDKIENLRKLRVLKKNLIHIHGIPKSLANADLLESEEYLGQYGIITKIIISSKINEDNNKKAYSLYVTYSNELEAALAILCIDSLIIQGKIIRAFFGTTKYCNYFLDNEECPNFYRCIFLHQYINNNDIIINNNNNNFTYDEHLNLAKRIIDNNKLKVKYLIQGINKLNKNIFPSINYVFLSEEEKENYFKKGNIKYYKNSNIDKNFFLLNNIIVSQNNFNNKILFDGNNYINNLNINDINNKEKLKCLINIFEINDNNSISPIELNNIFHNLIKHILYAKPFYMSLKNINLQKLEYEYLIENLKRNDIDIYKLLDGCLDPVSHLI